MVIPRGRWSWNEECKKVPVEGENGFKLTNRRIILGRPRRRWEDNIKMDLREVGWGGMDWINLAQDRDRWRALVYTVMNLRVP
jgi:hypothetical protein